MSKAQHNDYEEEEIIGEPPTDFIYPSEGGIEIIKIIEEVDDDDNLDDEEEEEEL